MAKPDATLNLNLPYPIRKNDLRAARDEYYDEDPERPPTLRDISDFMIRFAVDRHPKFQPSQQAPTKGMDEINSRLWRTIMQELAERRESLTLPYDLFSWLKELVKSFEYRPNLSTWRWILLDEFERAKQAAEAPAPDADKKAEAAASTAAA